MDRREFHGTTLAALAAGLGGRSETHAPQPTDVNPTDGLSPGATVRFGSTRFHHLTESGNPGVNAFAFSPDGTQLAALGYQDNHVSLWATPTGRRIRKWGDNPADRGGGLAFSPDGRRLAVCGEGVRVWNLLTGQMVWASEGGYTTASDITFTPDGRQVVTADGFIGTVTVFDATSGRQLRQLDSGPHAFGYDHERADTFHSVAVSPDGRRLAAGSTYEIGHPVSGGDPAAGMMLQPLARHTRGGQPLGGDAGQLLARMKAVEPPPDMTALYERLSREYGGHGTRSTPDGRTVVPEPRGRVWVWDLRSGELLVQLDGHHTHGVGRVGFGPDGTLVSVGGNGAVNVWDVVSGTHLREIVTGGTARTGPSVALLPGGRVLVGRKGGAVVVDTRTGAAVPTAELPRWESWWRIGVSADGRYLATDRHRDQFEVWDCRTARACEPADRHTDWIQAVSFGPGERAAFTATTGELFEWDVRTGDRRRAYPVPGQLVPHTLAVSPDGRRMACGFQTWGVRDEPRQSGVCVWNTAAGTGRTWPTAGFVNALAWTADGRTLLLTTGDAGRVIPLPADGDEPEPAVWAAVARLSALAVSPDGATVAGVSALGPPDAPGVVLHLWHADGRPAGQFEHQLQSPVRPGRYVAPAVRFSPDCRRVAVSAGTGEVLTGPVGDHLTGRWAVVWPNERDEGVGTFALAFAADGRLLAVRSGGTAEDEGYGPHEVRAWDVAAGKEIWCSPPVRQPVVAVALSADGRRLLAGSWDTTAVVWELPAG